jgi:hypothetical protein
MARKNQEKYRSLEDGKEQDAFATRLESAIFLFHIDGICGLLRVLMFSHILQCPLREELLGP